MIIATLQRKGGVGKTTIAANMAYALASLTNREVTLLDWDAQGSLTRWAGRGSGFLSRAVRPYNVADDADPVAWATDALSVVAERKDHLTVIDTAPSYDDLSTLALMHADVFVIPVQPSPLDLEAAHDVIELIEQGIPGRSAPPLVALVPSKTKPRADLSAKIGGALDACGCIVLAAIGDRVANAEAAMVGMVTAEYKPRDQATTEWANLAKQLSKLIRR